MPIHQVLSADPWVHSSEHLSSKMDQVQWVSVGNHDNKHMQMDVIDVFPDQAKRSAKHWLDQWKFLAQRESIMLLGM